jgi:hypothetical protein
LFRRESSDEAALLANALFGPGKARGDKPFVISSAMGVGAIVMQE